MKLTILSDIERDQRLNDFKKTLDQSIEKNADIQRQMERKRDADHVEFNNFVKHARQNKLELKEKYGTLALKHLKLEKEYAELENKNTDANLAVENAAYIEKKNCKQCWI